MSAICQSLFLMRHEERESSIDYTASLNSNGLHRASEKIPDKVRNIDIEVIYCSPFRRTLQTIAPYCRETGSKVRLEWGLVESMPILDTLFTEFSDIIDPDYVSCVSWQPPCSQPCIDSTCIQKRVRTLLDNIDRSKKTLLVTHLPVINTFLALRNMCYIDLYTPHSPGCVLKIDGPL